MSSKNLIRVTAGEEPIMTGSGEYRAGGGGDAGDDASCSCKCGEVSEGAVK